MRHDEETTARMTAYATQNNWILPLKGEELAPPNYAKGLALDALFSFEKAPTFNRLQNTFWTAYFGDKTVKELRETATKLGLSKAGQKNRLVADLARYFRELTNA